MSEKPVPLPVGEHRILRHDEVEIKTGFKRAHIYHLMRQGKFQRPYVWNTCSRLGFARNRSVDRRAPQ